MPAIMTSQGEIAASKPSGLAGVLEFLGPALATAGMAYGQAKDAGAQSQKMKDWVSQNSVPMTNAQMVQDQQAFNGPQVPGLGQAFQLGNAFAGQTGGQLVSSPSPFSPQLGSGSMLNKFAPWPMQGNSFLGR